MTHTYTVVVNTCITLEEQAYCEVLIVELTTKTEHYTRNVVTVRQWHAVILIDDTITIHVTVLDITRTHNAEGCCLIWALTNIVFILEETLRDVTTQYTVWHTCHALIIVSKFVLLEVVNNVL